MYTISHNIKKEFVIKNSRFITVLIKINDQEEIKKHLEHIKKEYPRATHYCYAYKLGNTIKKASDDKEPSGTAGIPMLNVLEKEDITNILAVTIRYFGGKKLGAGGLIRAYSKSVKETLKEGKKKLLIPGIKCNITFPYSKEKEILKKIPPENIRKKKYLEKVTYQILLPETEILPNDLEQEILEKIYIEKD